MYGEEADLALGAKSRSRPIVTPCATIIHYGGASTASTLKQRILLLKGKATLMKRTLAAFGRALGGCYSFEHCDRFGGPTGLLHG
jgi:GT2 family glycosyltransferase